MILLVRVTGPGPALGQGCLGGLGAPTPAAEKLTAGVAPRGHHGAGHPLFAQVQSMRRFGVAVLGFSSGGVHHAPIHRRTFRVGENQRSVLGTSPTLRVDIPG